MNKPGECKDCKFSSPRAMTTIFCKRNPRTISKDGEDWCWQFQKKEEPEPEPEVIEPGPGYFVDDEDNYFHILGKCFHDNYSWFTEIISSAPDDRILSCIEFIGKYELTKRITEEEWNRRLKEVRGE